MGVLCTPPRTCTKGLFSMLSAPPDVAPTMAFPSQNQGGWMLTLFGRHKVQTTAVFKPAFGGWH